MSFLTMKKLYVISIIFVLFLVCTSGKLQTKKIVQSFYEQTCIFIDYKCNNTETGTVKLRVLSLECLPLDHESQINCTKLELVATQEIDCNQNKSIIKFTSNENFHDCKNIPRNETNNSMDHTNSCSFMMPADGLYMIEMSLDNTLLTKGESWNASWRSKHGYLPPAFWPLLIFYQVSLSIYFFYLVVWLVFCCYFHKELLQLQYYIAFIIFLGLVEKLVYLVEFEYFNQNGEEVAFNAIAFGELVSALKRSAARILVIVVSVGFGIVKPRLGRTLYVLTVAGFLYFVFSAAQGIHNKGNAAIQKRGLKAVLALALAIMDAIFFYWIFLSLIRTTRALRLRKNTAKLSVYRHFTKTLIFALITSVIFILWSLGTFQFGDCIKNWDQLWLDEAFWPCLFSILLLMIMILWRPSVNNQRYAYSALNDGTLEDDNESYEPMINDAFDGIKLRSRNDVEYSILHDQDDSLKWVEDNIPKSVDSVVSSTLMAQEDAEETLFEMNKLQ